MTSIYYYPICLVLFLILISHTVVDSKPFDIPASAECVSQQAACTEETALKSGICTANTKLVLQPAACKRTACKYCTWPAKMGTTLCKEWARKYVCSDTPQVITEIETVNPTEPPMQDIVLKDPETCVWMGSNQKVVIGLEHAKESSFWTKHEGGIMWKKDGGPQQDPAGSGSKCFHFKVPLTGNYYLTAITSAPHKVDHNDVWLKLSAGVEMYRTNTGVRLPSTEPTTNYFKAYQNYGRDIKANMLFNVDRKPHFLISSSMETGKPYEVCLSGRSSLFTVYKIVMVKCSPAESCNPYESYTQRAMRDITLSEC